MGGELKTADALPIAGLERHCWGVEEWQGCGGAAAATAVVTTAVTVAVTTALWQRRW